MPRYETTAQLANDRIPLEATGNVLEFTRTNLVFYAKASATTTVGTMPAATSLPVGLRFTLDNANGSGTMTITPTGQTAIAITTGKVYDFLVTASGVLKAGEFAAYPT